MHTSLHLEPRPLIAAPKITRELQKTTEQRESQNEREPSLSRIPPLSDNTLFFSPKLHS